MKKFLVRFFVSLCIFLITGYGQVYAQLYQSLQQTSSPAVSQTATHHHGRHAAVSAENPDCQFTMPLFEKAEDNDLTLFKKLLKAVPASSLLLSIEALPFLYFTGKSTLASRSELPPSSLNRYLLLQVFRL